HPLRSTFFPYTTLFRSLPVLARQLVVHFIVALQVSTSKHPPLRLAFIEAELLHQSGALPEWRPARAFRPSRPPNGPFRAGHIRSDRKSTRLNSSHGSIS